MIAQNIPEKINYASRKKFQKCLPFTVGQAFQVSRRQTEKPDKNQNNEIGVGNQVRLVPSVRLKAFE